eukprot:738376-Lingulodinium_polyedra.AAC.1
MRQSNKVFASANQNAYEGTAIGAAESFCACMTSGIRIIVGSVERKKWLLAVVRTVRACPLVVLA